MNLFNIARVRHLHLIIETCPTFEVKTKKKNRVEETPTKIVLLIINHYHLIAHIYLLNNNQGVIVDFYQ